MKILLHACCGPCSLEPVRLLREAGHELAVYYANANIHPEAEYARRLDTLRAWARDEGIPVIEGTYDVAAWEAAAGRFGASMDTREERCRACYRLRLEETALYAAAHGYDAVSTTLTVSPYQYTLVIEEEVCRAAEAAGIAAVFEDFRPQYDEATRRSRALGMYRQNYCGCRYSAAEAARERAERKAARAARKAAEQAAHADERAAEEAARAKRKAERAAYDEAQARKHAVLKALRAQRKAEARAAKDAS